MSNSHWTRATFSPQGHAIDVHGHVDDDTEVIRVVGHALRVLGTETYPTTQAMLGAIHRTTGNRRGWRLADERRYDGRIQRTYHAAS